jgi:hypothetical protein
MVDTDEDRDRSRRPAAEDWGWSSIGRGLGGRMIARYVLSAPCMRRRGARVSWFGLKTKVNDFFRFGLKTGGFRFPSLGLKTGSYCLMILASKSPRRFFDLDLKTKRATVCQLRHKIGGRMKMAWNTRRDLAACFTWKHVRLGFSSLVSRLVEVARMVHVALS